MIVLPTARPAVHGARQREVDKEHCARRSWVSPAHHDHAKNCFGAG